MLWRPVWPVEPIHTWDCFSVWWPETHERRCPWSQCIPDWSLADRNRGGKQFLKKVENLKTKCCLAHPAPHTPPTPPPPERHLPIWTDMETCLRILPETPASCSPPAFISAGANTLLKKPLLRSQAFQLSHPQRLIPCHCRDIPLGNLWRETGITLSFRKCCCKCHPRNRIPLFIYHHRNVQW